MTKELFVSRIPDVKKEENSVYDNDKQNVESNKMY